MALVLAHFVFGTASAHAQELGGTEAPSEEPARERLQLRLRGSATASCADAAALASEVGQLLGWRGVGLEKARRVVEVSLARSSTQLVATVSWLGPDGQEVGRRELAVGPWECERLRQALAFSLAVERGLDPNRRQSSRNPPYPRPPPVPSGQKPRPQPEPTRGLGSPSPSDVHWGLAAGLAARGGVVPEPSFGPQLGFELRRRWFSLELRALLLWPRDHAVARSKGFQYWEASSAVLACGAVEVLRFCPAFEAFYASVRGFGSSVTAAADAGVGLRVGGVMSVAFRLTQRWFGGVQAGAWLPTNGHGVALGNVGLWSAGAGYSFGLELRRSFP